MRPGRACVYRSGQPSGTCVQRRAETNVATAPGACGRCFHPRNAAHTWPRREPAIVRGDYAACDRQLPRRVTATTAFSVGTPVPRDALHEHKVRTCEEFLRAERYIGDRIRDALCISLAAGLSGEAGSRQRLVRWRRPRRSRGSTRLSRDGRSTTATREAGCRNRRFRSRKRGARLYDRRRLLSSARHRAAGPNGRAGAGISVCVSVCDLGRLRA